MTSILTVLATILALLIPGGDATAPASSSVPVHRVSDTVESDPASLNAPREIGWDSVERVDADTLRVTFMAGVSACYGFYTEVEETPESVTVRVFSGMHPGVEVCIDMAEQHSIVVDLAEPLGHRPVLGSRS